MIGADNATMNEAAACKTCDGTGWIYAMNSWFTAEGYYKLRCGICAGSGFHDFRPDADYKRFQETARARIKEWGGMKPPLTQIEDRAS